MVVSCSVVYTLRSSWIDTWTKNWTYGEAFSFCIPAFKSYVHQWASNAPVWEEKGRTLHCRHRTSLQIGSFSSAWVRWFFTAGLSRADRDSSQIRHNKLSTTIVHGTMTALWHRINITSTQSTTGMALMSGHENWRHNPWLWEPITIWGFNWHLLRTLWIDTHSAASCWLIVCICRK